MTLRSHFNTFYKCLATHCHYSNYSAQNGHTVRSFLRFIWFLKILDIFLGVIDFLKDLTVHSSLVIFSRGLAIFERTTQCRLISEKSSTRITAIHTQRRLRKQILKLLSPQRKLYPLNSPLHEIALLTELLLSCS